MLKLPLWVLTSTCQNHVLFFFTTSFPQFDTMKAAMLMTVLVILCAVAGVLGLPTEGLPHLTKEKETCRN